MIIRNAGFNDIPVIQQLVHIVWPETYVGIISKEQIEYMLNLFYSDEALREQIAKGDHFIIAEADNQPVGFASYSLKPGRSGIYRLNKLYVLTGKQGNGTGKSLLETIFSEIINNNGSSLELNVNRHNKAVSFYEHVGFKILHEEDIDIGNSFFMNDYVMIKSFS